MLKLAKERETAITQRSSSVLHLGLIMNGEWLITDVREWGKKGGTTKAEDHNL